MKRTLTSWSLMPEFSWRLRRRKRLPERHRDFRRSIILLGWKGERESVSFALPRSATTTGSLELRRSRCRVYELNGSDYLLELFLRDLLELFLREAVDRPLRLLLEPLRLRERLLEPLRERLEAERRLLLLRRLPPLLRRLDEPLREREELDRDAAARRPPFLPPLRDELRFDFFPRPDPLFLPPPVSLFTVAHARRSASPRETPRFSYPSSICSACRFCLFV